MGALQTSDFTPKSPLTGTELDTGTPERFHALRAGVSRTGDRGGRPQCAGRTNTLAKTYPVQAPQRGWSCCKTLARRTGSEIPAAPPPLRSSEVYPKLGRITQGLKRFERTLPGTLHDPVGRSQAMTIEKALSD
jgi:hypothetical protein